MTNETKEIQERLNYYKTIQKEPVYCEKLITTGELQRLLDYITNLQQENERLKGDNEFLKKEIIKLERKYLKGDLLNTLQNGCENE